MMKRFVLKLIHLYQKYLPKPVWGCRFSPSCSRYSCQAIEKYGILHGSVLGFKRIIRCHPWSPGGYDPLL
jgi:putative membrane protein insertion efficiency factor